VVGSIFINTATRSNGFHHGTKPMHGDPLGWIWGWNDWFEELVENKWK
jgi:hypothetical protein